MASRPEFDALDPERYERLREVSPAIGDPFNANNSRKRRRKKLEMTPSQWVEKFVRIKDADQGQVKAMDFGERRYLRRIYDTPSPKILLFTSRQTEKSTTIANRLLAQMGMIPLRDALFVSPSAMQTKVFSSARLDTTIDVSPLLKGLTSTSLTMNLLEKEFLTRSRIYLRYAFLSADRIRGLSASSIYADEIQDLLQELMPVIEETASHHQEKTFCYSGTPKTFDNTIDHYWSKSSTQSEWCIPCERHGTPGEPGTWHWNVLGPNNLGKHGPICDRCGGPLNPEHPLAQWVQMNPGAEFEGFRICRLMVPWYVKIPKQWNDILLSRERYPVSKFMNEVLALSYDSGTKPISRAELIRACDDAYLMDEDEVARMRQSVELYAGLDHGPGEGASYAHLSIGGYVRPDSGFQILYCKRFDGPLVEPEAQEKELIRLLTKFRIKYVAADYGHGFVQNKRLTSVFGPRRVHQFQYAARAPAKLVYKAALHRSLVFRTPVMSDIFAAIKAMKIRFPAWSVFQSPHGDDILSIRSEYSETLRMIKYDKPRGIPDDAFHSITFCVLASMFDHKRPDIMVPIQEAAAGEEALANLAEAAFVEEIEMRTAPLEEYLAADLPVP